MTHRDCIEWKGMIGGKSDPYGRVSTFFLTGRKTHVKAHRFVYEWAFGQIPKNRLVLHRCDNPLCVNPDHLYLGNHGQNLQDAYDRKRRSAKGERNSQAKLQSFQVASIRVFHESFTQAEIARLYGIDQSAVSLIVNGKRWGQ